MRFIWIRLSFKVDLDGALGQNDAVFDELELMPGTSTAQNGVIDGGVGEGGWPLKMPEGRHLDLKVKSISDP